MMAKYHWRWQPDPYPFIKRIAFLLKNDNDDITINDDDYL